MYRVDYFRTVSAFSRLDVVFFCAGRTIFSLSHSTHFETGVAGDIDSCIAGLAEQISCTDRATNKCLIY